MTLVYQGTYPINSLHVLRFQKPVTHIPMVTLVANTACQLGEAMALMICCSASYFATVHMIYTQFTHKYLYIQYF